MNLIPNFPKSHYSKLPKFPNINDKENVFLVSLKILCFYKSIKTWGNFLETSQMFSKYIEINLP